MRVFVMSLAMLCALGCANVYKPTTNILHGQKAAEAAARTLPPSITDLSQLKSESYKSGGLQPWLIDRDTHRILAVDIYRAIYHPTDNDLQIEFLNPDGLPVIEVYDLDRVTLMTQDGPCVINSESFICPE